MQTYAEQNDLDENDRPAGGWAQGVGFRIDWQRGPLREQGTDAPAEPNGAFVETIIDVARQRIAHYQDTEFACPENAAALVHLEAALAILDKRQQDRAARGVAGTHEV